MWGLCIICAETFEVDSSLSATPCGHVFHYSCVMRWLERSSTCPQCRNPVSCTKIIPKLYFIAGSEADDEEDQYALRNKVNALQVQVMEAQKNIAASKKTLEEEVRLKEAFQTKASLLENKVHVMEEMKETLGMQLEYLSKENSKMTKCQKENTELKAKLQQCNNLEVFLNGSVKEMNEILERYTNRAPECRDLAQYCAIMKQNYGEAVKTKQELKAKEKALIAENMKCEKKIHLQEETIRKLQLEVYSAKLKNDKLEEKLKVQVKTHTGRDAKFQKAERLENESQATQLQKDPFNDSEDLEFIEIIPTLRFTSNKENSPNFPLKECSIAATIAAGGIAPQQANVRTSQGVKASSSLFINECDSMGYKNFNIMKRQAVTSKFPEKLKLGSQAASGELGYNGLGGHSKLDLFPTGKVGLPKKMKTCGSTKVAVHQPRLDSLIENDDDD